MRVYIYIYICVCVCLCVCVCVCCVVCFVCFVCVCVFLTSVCVCFRVFLHQCCGGPTEGSAYFSPILFYPVEPGPIDFAPRMQVLMTTQCILQALNALPSEVQVCLEQFLQWQKESASELLQQELSEDGEPPEEQLGDDEEDGPPEEEWPGPPEEEWLKDGPPEEGPGPPEEEWLGDGPPEKEWPGGGGGGVGPVVQWSSGPVLQCVGGGGAGDRGGPGGRGRGHSGGATRSATGAGEEGHAQAKLSLPCVLCWPC